jgi:hypothetical protein
MAGKNVLWLRSIPSTKPSGDDHDQYDLQRQTDDRGEARNAIEKSVPEQPAKQTCAKETGSDPAEQSAAEQARTDCWPMGAAHAMPALTLAVSWLYRSEPGHHLQGFR